MNLFLAPKHMDGFAGAPPKIYRLVAVAAVALNNNILENKPRRVQSDWTRRTPPRKQKTGTVGERSPPESGHLRFHALFLLITAFVVPQTIQVSPMIGLCWWRGSQITRRALWIPYGKIRTPLFMSKTYTIERGNYRSLGTSSKWHVDQTTTPCTPRRSGSRAGALSPATDSVLVLRPSLEGELWRLELGSYRNILLMTFFGVVCAITCVLCSEIRRTNIRVAVINTEREMMRHFDRANIQDKNSGPTAGRGARRCVRQFALKWYSYKRRVLLYM